jgi:hypothetical protein
MMEFLKAIERKREANKAESMANQLKMEAERKADKEIMARMEAKLDSNQGRINANQQETKTAINSIWSELEETIKTQMEKAVACLNQQTQGLREEIDETQQHLQVAMTSINTWTGSLQDERTSVKKALQTELDIRAQGLEVRIAEVEARVELGVGGRTGNDTGRVKPP